MFKKITASIILASAMFINTASATLITTDIEVGGFELINLITWTPTGIEMGPRVDIFNVFGDLKDDGSGIGLFDSISQIFYTAPSLGKISFTSGQLILDGFYQQVNTGYVPLDITFEINYSDAIYDEASGTLENVLTGTLFYGVKQALFSGYTNIISGGSTMYFSTATNNNTAPTSVPEPTTFAIMLLGLGLLTRNRKIT